MRRMQLGTVIDYCIEYDRQQSEGKKKKDGGRRKATQADIDVYFGGRKKK